MLGRQRAATELISPGIRHGHTVKAG
jgi:hypothetical protein